MATTNSGMLMLEVALRIKSLRLDCGYSIEQMAELTGFSLAECELYENGNADLPFSFIHKCAELFDVEQEYFAVACIEHTGDGVVFRFIFFAEFLRIQMHGGSFHFSVTRTEKVMVLSMEFQVCMSKSLRLCAMR